MLVIQRSLRKSASLVEAREQAHQHNRRCLSCVAEGKAKKAASAPAARRSETTKLHYSPGSGDIFLQGKSVLLQHRLSSKAHIVLPSNPVTSLCDNKPSKSFAFPSPRREKHVRKKKHNSETKTRPPSQKSRHDIASQETVQQPRKRKARTPLLMSTMSLPNENLATLTSKEASKRHLNREDAQATLERLLATRNHQLPSTSTSKPLSSAADATLRSEEKSAYLQDSYDYFQRHLQNLNSVIHSFNQQEINETSQSSQKQKKRVDIYQNYCGDDACVKNKLEGFQLQTNDSARASDSSTQRSSKCDEYCSNYSVRRQSEKSFSVQKDSSGIDSQFQDIHLEEVEPAINKPVITLNHVTESFSAERYEVSVVRPTRSPSPLLEVPQTILNWLIHFLIAILADMLNKSHWNKVCF
ncbi:Uncharacterized protein GBIM_14109 [Gryllus bimaculatus]|nr:Uncharacterized protein GBIM_14109 [Gryllus bimaculatus]